MDAVEWLRAQTPCAGASFFASLPDYSEFPGRSLTEWKGWFRETAALILSRTPDDGVALFFQSDIKVDGAWVDKAFLCQQAAEASGHALLFHKIFCRAPVGTPTFGRPGYSHLLAFSRGVRAEVGRSTADVVEEVGEKTWVRGTGFRAATLACRFVAEETSTRFLVNPFCGEGAVLAVANSRGLHALGIERSPKRAEKARRLEVAADGRSWKRIDGVRDAEADAKG